MIHTDKTPTTIGIDLAKNIFHLHALDEEGNTLWAKMMKPENATLLLENLNPCIIGIEASGGSHYWHRTFAGLGHEVRMITPQRAKAFREGQKNEKNDAEAIAHAVMNRHTRLVAPKTLKQQEVCSLNAMRNLYIRQRNMMINHMRGTLKEYGIPCRKGARYFENNIDNLLAEQIENCSFSEKVAEGLLMQSLMLKTQREHITECEKQIAILSERDECKRLKTIPGVGNIVSTQLYGHGGSVSHYKKGSDFAASLGLVPRQHSTGGKQIYGSISKRGNVSIRTNLIHGARSVLTVANKKRKTRKSSGNDMIDWALQCYDRMGMNRASVALANKIARIS
jgi:transposase